MPIRLMVAILAICATAFSTNIYAAYGRTAGTFAVSALGNAQYTIPIWAPPGPRDVEPQVSLFYDSSQSIGPLGIGWSIGGLGQITRCGKTVAQDGAASAIALTVTDGYCVNGNRLRLVTGTYGEAGSTYQTEIADYSNVTANGTAGSGPQYWTVRTKKGLTYYYGYVDANGNGENSAAVAKGTSTVLTWFLSKVDDRAGNNYVINYTGESGTAVPSEILWTPTTYGASSYAYKMLFIYGTNTAASSISEYVAGTVVSNTALLTSIEIESSGNVIKDYFLGYQSSPMTGREELISVTECATATETSANCLLPTSVGYQTGSPGVSTTSNTASSGPLYLLSTRYDFDGDGYPDLVYENSSGVWCVAFGSESGYGSPVSTGIAANSIAVFGNINGGIEDGIVAPNGATLDYYTWNGSAFTGISTGVAFDGLSQQLELADVNGDGLPDLITLDSDQHNNGNYSENIYVNFNTSTGTSPSFSSTRTTVYSAGGNSGAFLQTPDSQLGKQRRFDFNGDGLDDLVLEISTNSNTLETYELISTGNTFNAVSITSLTGSSSQTAYFTNWNDDKSTDIVVGNTLYIASCAGTVAETYALSGTVVGAMDWNGDGRTDLLVANGSNLGVYLSEGTGTPVLTATTVPYSAGCQYAWLDANGDGLDDLGCWAANGTKTLTYYLHNGTSDLAASFADGYGNSVAPTYAALSETNYTINGPVQVMLPDTYYVGPMYVVTKAAFSDPTAVASTYSSTYSYSNGSINLQGRGFNGFGQIQIQDSRTSLGLSVLETRQYALAFPYTGIISDDMLSAGDSQFKRIINTLSVSTLISTANNQSYFPYVGISEQLSREVGGSKDGLLIATSNINYGTPDSYGNFDTVSSVLTDNDAASPYFGDTWTTTTTNTIAPDASTWCLNLPTETTVTKSSTAPYGGAISRTVNYTPDYTNCRQKQKVTAPGTAYQVTEVYGYDTTFGNLQTDAVTGYNAVTKVTMPTRTTTFGWSTTGQFLQTVQNPLDQTVTYSFDPNSGFKTSQTDPNWTSSNPLTTTWSPDPFFRPSTKTNLDGTSTTWAYSNCATNGCVNANNRMTITQTTVNVGGGTQRTENRYTDSLDRPLVTSKQMLNGAYDRNEVQYDNLGRVVQQGAPCTFSCGTPYWTTNTYDVLNRITQSERQKNAASSTLLYTNYGYAGRTSTVQDPLLNTTSRITLLTGSLARITDAKGYSVNFSYDAFGSLISTTDSASPSNTLSTAQYSYGLKAFKTASTDMDLGARTYTVDPLGEVTAYTDNKNQSFSMTYDSLSRPSVRTEPDLTTTWNWGNSASNSNIGKLASVTAAGSAGTWSDTYSYDSLGRYSSETISNPGDRTYTYVKTYDSATGLPASLQYPVDISFILTLQYAYSYGILQSISSNSYSPSITYWTANATNPWGQVTTETLGNGVVKTSTYDAVTGLLGSVKAGVGGGYALQNNTYTYDGDGNLIERQDGNQGLTENFYPDALNRLDHSTLGGTLNLQMEYDTTGMGNIASRSDVSSGEAWTYDPVRKHAVTQAGSNAYTYDGNGNASSRNGYPITWTSYNLPTGISTATESVQFAYDANRQRWQEIYTGGPNGTETTYRAGRLFEVDNYGGLAHYRHFVYAGNELVSIDDRTTVSTPQYYVASDHQGSFVSILTSDTSENESCPAGYTLSGSVCTENVSQSATTSYACPPGYTLSGSNCVDTTSVSATVKYACPSGYSLSGTTCSEVVTVAATLGYSCPSGYTLSGTTCSETQSEPATWVCPTGGGKPQVTSFATCPNGATGHYTCPSGWTLSGSTCSQTVTQAATSSYSCPAGYALSGTTCSETLSQAATSSYSCPAGYTLSGTTCSETSTVAATVSYACPTGYTLSGSTCSETLTVAATGAGQSVFVPESFTPFGNRRNGETWAGAPTTSDSNAINSVSRRGYTGESALGISMGLNHLNGRVEDAVTGRFLSADSFIQSAETQSFNRYTYVNNNPMSATDPSGFARCQRCQFDGRGNPFNPGMGIGAPLFDNSPIGGWDNYDLDAIGEAADTMTNAVLASLGSSAPNYAVVYDDTQGPSTGGTGENGLAAQSQAGSDPCAAGGCIDQVTVTASRPPPAFFLGFPSMFFAPAGTDFQALWQLGRQFAAQGLSAKQLGVQIANNPLINFQILSKAQGLGYGFYQDAANFAVGVVSEGFFNGSYIGWAEMSFGGQIYGAWNSTNWNTSMPGYWQTWWNAGWNAASNGNFPVQVGTPLQMSYPLQ